jgi:flagellar basal-body rod protein FlgC
MGIDRVSSPIDVAVSGLKAESLRMDVVANNIANANTTQTGSGAPFRRQSVVLGTDQSGISGVRIQGLESDTATELKKVMDPGNPDADEDGNVLSTNVDLPTEMMSMMMASRAYQANATVLKKYEEMVDEALDALK